MDCSVHIRFYRWRIIKSWNRADRYESQMIVEGCLSFTTLPPRFKYNVITREDQFEIHVSKVTLLPSLPHLLLTLLLAMYWQSRTEEVSEKIILASWIELRWFSGTYWIRIIQTVTNVEDKELMRDTIKVLAFISFSSWCKR